jgi:hypothetical protein
MDRINMYDEEDDYKIQELYTKAPSKKKAELFQFILLHFSDAKELEDAIEEWSIDSVSDSMMVRNSISGQSESSSFCICSQEISQRYFVKNDNGNILRIGNECINKFMSDALKHQANIFKRQMQYEKSGTGLHRMCAVCHRHNIPSDKPSWMVTCKTCFKSGHRATSAVHINNRPCSNCNQLLIPRDAPQWRTLCPSCYKNNCRPCSKCFKKIIPNTEPSWKQVCNQCYHQ